MLKRIAIATLLAGTLDLLAAITLTLVFGRHVPDMLRYVASGPFPAAPGWGSGGAVLGVFVHFALMAVMAAVFMFAAERIPALLRRPLAAGVLYGLATYVVMNLLVVPIRFGKWPPTTLGIATQLFCHVVLVGVPIAWIAVRERE